MDFVWGFFWAAMAGMGCAIVTGIVEFLFDVRGELPWQVLLACPALTGIAIGAVFGKRVGRLDLRKQGAALFLLTLCATLVGEFFYASIYVVRTFHVAITPHLLIAIFRGLMRYRAKFDGLVIQATQFFGAFVCIGFARLQRPIFRAEYISISEARTRAGALATTELSIL
jgi:hypothetical protein